MAELGRICRSEQAAKKRKYRASASFQARAKRAKTDPHAKLGAFKEQVKHRGITVSMRIRGSLSNLACTAGVQMKESCVGLLESTVTAPTAARMSFPVAQLAIS